MAEFGPEPIVSSPLACDLRFLSNDPSSFPSIWFTPLNLVILNFATWSSSTCTIQLNFFYCLSLFQKNMFKFFLMSK